MSGTWAQYDMSGGGAGWSRGGQFFGPVPAQQARPAPGRQGNWARAAAAGGTAAAVLTSISGHEGNIDGQFSAFFPLAFQGWLDQF